MIGTMWVKAATGMKVPREENARRYITEADGAVEVPRSMYYTRCVMFGDLVAADAPAAPSSAPASATSKGGK